MPRRAQRSGIQRTDPKTRQRAAWGTVSRDQVVDAAIRAIEIDGYERMTIRSLAARLGVAPMTLYRHVRGKDDLLDEVADRLLAKTWRPRTSRGNWRKWTAEAARRLRDLLVAQPAVLHVYLRHPVVSPTAMVRMEEMLDVLREAGFDRQSARRAYASVQTYTVGFSALEASRARWAATNESANSIERQLAAFTTPRQFADGLTHLLDGVERHMGGGPGRADSTRA
ncbi:MAG: TetR/AcrR family transcriptional regulator [Acidimicrobiales bacterium]